MKINIPLICALLAIGLALTGLSYLASTPRTAHTQEEATMTNMPSGGRMPDDVPTPNELQIIELETDVARLDRKSVV